MNELFRKFAQKTSQIVGTSWAFILAALIIVVWGITGPMFHYSDTWQLVINTGTTIITFLMVFLIQNTQNRDAKAIHLKLDELIKGVKGARTGFVNLEELSDEELERLRQEFAKLQKKVNHQDRPSAQLSEYEDVIEAAEDAKEAEERPS
jgi:low affinity Fe/Cu permease